MVECTCQYRAQAAGITILNEIGLDPGIDHLTAMRTIDEVLEQGGQVRKLSVTPCMRLMAIVCSDYIIQIVVRRIAYARGIAQHFGIAYAEFLYCQMNMISRRT